MNYTKLIHKIMEGRGEYQQFYNRIRVYTPLHKLNPSDTKRIVKSVVSSSNGVWKYFHKPSRQNICVLLKLLSDSIRVARINNSPIDKYLIEETTKALVFKNGNLNCSGREIFIFVSRSA